MKLTRIVLPAQNLEALHDFYAVQMGLPATWLSSDELQIQVGWSRLVFARSRASHKSHYAFNVPRNQFADAKTWLARHVPVIKNEQGEDTFFADDWNADRAYFFDPDGNIAEIVARYTLDVDANTPFTAKSLMCVSEIGIASTGDAQRTVRELQTQFDLPVYSDVGNITFCPVGDEEGLFIVVREGREWFMSNGIIARPFPLEAQFQLADGVNHTLLYNRGSHESV